MMYSTLEPAQKQRAVKMACALNVDVEYVGVLLAGMPPDVVMNTLRDFSACGHYPDPHDIVALYQQGLWK